MIARQYVLLPDPAQSVRRVCVPVAIEQPVWHLAVEKHRRAVACGLERRHRSEVHALPYLMFCPFPIHKHLRQCRGLESDLIGKDVASNTCQRWSPISRTQKKAKNIQQEEFARGHPPHYYSPAIQFICHDRTGMGSLWMLWPYVTNSGQTHYYIDSLL